MLCTSKLSTTCRQAAIIQMCLFGLRSARKSLASAWYQYNWGLLSQSWPRSWTVDTNRPSTLFASYFSAALRCLDIVLFLLSIQPESDTKGPTSLVSVKVIAQPDCIQGKMIILVFKYLLKVYPISASTYLMRVTYKNCKLPLCNCLGQIDKGQVIVTYLLRTSVIEPPTLWRAQGLTLYHSICPRSIRHNIYVTSSH